MADRHAPPPIEALGIGERLRNAREARGWTLADVEQLTKIRGVYLQALEEEQFDRLPGGIYARGFLRTYAVALGLDPNELLQAYPRAFRAAEQPIVGVHPVEVPIRPAAPRSRLRRIALYGAGVLLLAVIVLSIIGYQQLRQFNAPLPSREAQAPPAPEPAPVPTEPVPPPAVPAPAAEPVRPAPAARPQPPAAQGLAVEIKTSDTSWLRITADGTIVFEGLVHAGEARRWAARKQLTVRVGNMPVVEVLVNGQRVQPKTNDRVWEQTFTAP